MMVYGVEGRMGCVEETLSPTFDRVHCGLLRKDRKCLCVVVSLVAYVRACALRVAEER
jgi:hypothetical protein